MKKRIVALICAFMMCLMCQNVGLAASDTLELDLNGRALTLHFDPSEQFSNISGGRVQASFFTYIGGSGGYSLIDLICAMSLCNSH